VDRRSALAIAASNPRGGIVALDNEPHRAVRQGSAVEPGFAVAVVLLVLLFTGGGVALVRNRALPWGAPSPRPLSLARGNAATAAKNGPIDEPAPPAPRPIAANTALAPARSPAPSPRPVVPAAPSGDDGEEPPATPLAARLERIETRLDDLLRVVERQRAEFQAEITHASAVAATRMQADQTRWEAALERLRADLLVAVAIPAADRKGGPGTRRAEVSADLYARLARLEAALAAVTNPVLLPGESYAPPDEFLPESLVWENWSEVGERAFALADAFNAQRLHLSDTCCGEFEAFVTSLRNQLTRSVYPNLQPEPSLTQQTALRAALTELATELPRARLTLEREYREGQ
jgi:hypothetical protein